MKILIMGFAKIKYMPYLNMYLENCDSQKNDIHLLYWNRDLQEEDTSALKKVTLHEFRLYQEDDVSKSSKIGGFIKYRKAAKKLIREEKFDFIIVLHSLPGVVTVDILKKQFKNRFIFDYRDSTYEGFAPYKKIIGSLVENSYATFVSSDAFRVFLPENCSHKIYTSHNLLTDSLSHRDERDINGIESEKIRIAFWGFIRHEEVNREIIKKIGADERFELHYYGREQQTAGNLKHYVTEKGIGNVFFHGEYKPEDRYLFVRETDIIHNIYYDSNTRYAMGNKYYDSIIFRIPQLCFEGTFMAECSEKYGIGIGCNPYDEDFTEKIYSYYKDVAVTDSFKVACDNELSRVLNEVDFNSDFLKNIQ